MPGDHREVEVAVGVARERRLLPGWRLGQPALGDERDDVEVGPPEARRSPRSRASRRSPRAAASSKPAPAPIATIDSPRAMITIRPCRSAKWPGWRRKLSGAEEQRRAVVDQDREDPDRGPRLAVERAGDDQQRRAEQQPGRQLQDRPEVVARRHPGGCSGRRGSGAWRGRRSRRSRTAAPRRRTPPGCRARRSASPPSRRTSQSRFTFSSGSIALVSQP